MQSGATDDLTIVVARDEEVTDVAPHVGNPSLEEPQSM
jgi:hypothetical protein